MRPYWVVVEPSNRPSVLNLGVGITAASEADVRAIFAAAFGDAHKVAQVRAIADVAELDQKHVAPNMGNMLKRGVWFPRGHEHDSG